ncbi:hypothetical protein LDENG_00075330 [Lucifuga dentata]|nr:hypothetical protein LDENG_00075330 [Lucifuga dentata]
MLLLSSSSVCSLLPLFLLQTALGTPQRDAAAEEAVECGGSGGGSFRGGQDGFVLDAEDAVTKGATFLAAAEVYSPEDCVRVCCGKPLCNLALLEPPGPGQNTENNRTCSLFDCLHRNHFVCRFINQPGFSSYIRVSVFNTHLQGPGEKALPIANAGKDVVVQPNSSVMLNGIESLALGDAHITEYHWTQLSGDASVKMEPTEYPDQVRLSDLQPGSHTFQLTVTDSDGQSHRATVTVLVLSPELSDLYCLSPVKVGPCRAAFPRWYLNAVSGGCEQFLFGGCKPNLNNFLSKEECSTACSNVSAASERSVTLPAKEECGSACLPGQLVCDNGCCLDRRWECDGLKQCSDGSDESHCRKLNQTFNELLDIDVNQKRARCTEPPRTGPCRANHTHWYYDPLNRKCSRFTYGGCNGSENNFEKEDTCSKTCDGVTERHVFARGVFERFEKEEDNSGSVAFAVLLSVAILTILAILTYCFLKSRRKRSHQPVATGPAHVALSEQDTLVYNSTTKPV